MSRQTTTHEELIKLTLKLAPLKDELQKQFDSGLKSTVFAKEHGISDVTARKVLTGLGIKWSIRDPERKPDGEKLALNLQKLRVVLLRICNDLKVDSREIEPGYWLD